MSDTSSGPPAPARRGAQTTDAPTRGLYRGSFTTEGLTEEERLWAYTAAGNASLATTALTDQLDVEMQTFVLGGVTLIHARSSPRRSERTAAMTADGQDAIFAQLTLQGFASGEIGGRSVRTGPGDLIVFDLSQPLVMVDEGPREGISVIFPREAVAAVVADPAGLHGLVLGPERNGLFAEHLRGLVPRLPETPNAAGRALARVLLELFAVVLERPLVEEPAIAALEAADAHDRERVAALTWIDAHLADPDLDPSGVAIALNLSRSRLYKLFEALGGVAGHIWKRRLSAVHQSLLNPDERRSIAELSYAWGFGSEAHFARAFRAAYGKSPGQVRKEALGRA